MNVTPHKPRSACELLHTIDDIATRALRQVEKDVRNDARRLLSYELRLSELGERIILWHIGARMDSPAVFAQIVAPILAMEQTHRTAHNLPDATVDEVWDAAYGMILTYMHGFKAKHGLMPRFSPGEFVALEPII